MDSVPVSAVDLNLSFEEYEEIARNIGLRMPLISRYSRDAILERANHSGLIKHFEEICKLQEDMCNDKEVYRIAGLKYWKGPPAGENLFMTGIIDYLLRNKPELSYPISS